MRSKRTGPKRLDPQKSRQARDLRRALGLSIPAAIDRQTFDALLLLVRDLVAGYTWKSTRQQITEMLGSLLAEIGVIEQSTGRELIDRRHVSPSLLNHLRLLRSATNGFSLTESQVRQLHDAPRLLASRNRELEVWRRYKQRIHSRIVELANAERKRNPRMSDSQIAERIYPVVCGEFKDDSPKPDSIRNLLNNLHLRR